MTLTYDDPILAALSLLQRQALLRSAARLASAAKRLHLDRELRRIGEDLARMPAEVRQSITQAAAETGRPVDRLTRLDVLRCQRRCTAAVVGASRGLDRRGASWRRATVPAT